MNEIGDLTRARAKRAVQTAKEAAKRPDQLDEFVITEMFWQRTGDEDITDNSCVLIVQYRLPDSLRDLHERLRTNPAFGLKLFAAISQICFSGKIIIVEKPERVSTAVVYDPPPIKRLAVSVAFRVKECPNPAVRLLPKEAFHQYLFG
jgi:hypothetical protein